MPLLILTVVDAMLFTAWVVTLNVQPSLSHQLMTLLGVVIALSAFVLVWAIYEALTYGQ